jgi:hypothetical protein
VKANHDDFIATNQSITQALFEGKQEISLKKFLDIKTELRETLWHYEFYQYQVDEDECISGRDFAHSLLIYLPYSKLNKYIHRINSLEHPGKVSL